MGTFKGVVLVIMGDGHDCRPVKRCSCCWCWYGSCAGNTSAAQLVFGCTTEASVEIYYGAVTQAVFDAVFEAKTRCELKVESFLYTSPLFMIHSSIHMAPNGAWYGDSIVGREMASMCYRRGSMPMEPSIPCAVSTCLEGPWSVPRTYIRFVNDFALFTPTFSCSDCKPWAQLIFLKKKKKKVLVRTANLLQ